MIKKLFSSQLRINVLSGFLATGLGIIVTALKYPLYLHFLDYEVYGTWLMLTTVMAMAQLGMLGIGPAVTKLVAEEVGKNVFKSAAKYVSTAMLTLLCSGLLLVVVIMLFNSQILNLFGFKGPSRVIGETYLVYMCLLTVYIFLYQAINATVAGLGRMDIANYSQTALQLLPLLISVPMLLSGRGVASLLVGNVFAYIFVSIANVIFISRISKIKIFVFSSISIEHFKKLMKFGVPVFGSSIASMFFMPVTKIFISNYVGIASVPIYEVASRATSQVLGLFNMGFKALMPELSRLNSSSTCHSDERIRKIQRKSLLFSIIAGFLVCSSIFIVCPMVFIIWLGQEYRPEISDATRTMLLGAFLSITSLVSYYNLLARGETTKFFIYHLIFPTINLLALIVIFVVLDYDSVRWAALANVIGGICGWLYLFPQGYSSGRKERKVHLQGVNDEV